MANYTNLKSTINAQIRANGTGAITGPVLNGVLRDMVSALGEAGYLYKGVATPATSPGTPDSNVFYIASTAGTYTNFGGAVVADGEVAILKYNGTWTKEVTGAATAAQVTQLGQDVEDYIETVESDEYTELLIDPDNKILESRDVDGKKTIYTDVEILGKLTSDSLPDIENKPSLQYVDAVIDADGKMIEGTTNDGEKVFFGGIVTEDATPITPGKLYGKKWVVLGDSFTNGGTENGTISENGKYKGSRCVYPYIIANRTGMDIVKFFEGGRTLAFPASPGAFVNSVTCPTQSFYYQNIPADADYITIYLGINDEGHATGSGQDGEDYTGVIPLGTITDSTTATYYGAWNVVLTWLRENRPFAHIGIIVSNGLSDSAYVTAQIEIAKKYGYPYINLNGDESCPAMIRSTNTDIPSSIRTIINQKQAVDYDGSQTGTVNRHPNRNAHIYESTFIENFLNTL